MQSIEQIYRHDEWWDKLNFSQLERDVRRFQGRIYGVSKKGDMKGVTLSLLNHLGLSNLEVVTQISERTRGDATGTLGLSHVRGNSHAWFLEGKGSVMIPTYSTTYKHGPKTIIILPCFIVILLFRYWKN